VNEFFYIKNVQTCVECMYTTRVCIVYKCLYCVNVAITIKVDNLLRGANVFREGGGK